MSAPGVIVVLLLAALSVPLMLAIRRYRHWQARKLPFYKPGELLFMAHRGAPARAPENTLPAFAEAAVTGVDGIELDVQVTADGVVVVRHDYDLERTTDGEGYIWDQTWDELSRLNAAHRQPGGYPPTPVPRLEEVLPLIPKHMLVNIELKSERWVSTGVERKVVAMVQELGLVHRTLISSFNPFCLLRIRYLEPKLPLALNWWDVDVPWLLRKPRLLNLLQPDCLHPSVDVVTPEVVGRAHSHGVRVNVWTVNNRPLIDYLRSIGVDGIITDFPELVQKSINANELNPPTVAAN
ncbi:MAG: glycerophosphodiester phosphodiesterase family protein [Candidatus Neomarinimicrobiota bacterium]